MDISLITRKPQSKSKRVEMITKEMLFEKRHEYRNTLSHMSKSYFDLIEDDDIEGAWKNFG